MICGVDLCLGRTKLLGPTFVLLLPIPNTPLLLPFLTTPSPPPFFILLLLLPIPLPSLLAPILLSTNLSTLTLIAPLQRTRSTNSYAQFPTTIVSSLVALLTNAAFIALIAMILRVAILQLPPLLNINFLLRPLALAFPLAFFKSPSFIPTTLLVYLGAIVVLIIIKVNKVIAIIGLLRVRYSSKVKISLLAYLLFT